MFKQIWKYLRVFCLIQIARFGKELSLKANLPVQILGSMCFFWLHIISFKLVLSKFSFPGWPVSHMWVLLLTFEIFTYLAFFMLWKGLHETVQDINMGRMDIIFAKPMSSRFIAFFRSGGIHNLLSVMLAIGLLIGTIIHFSLGSSFIGIAGYIISIIFSLLIFHSLTVIVMSLNFIFGHIPGSDYFFFQFQEVKKYPYSQYLEKSVILKISLLPLALLTSMPATIILLKKVEFPWIIYYLVVGIISIVLSQILWKYGTRRYSSASS